MLNIWQSVHAAQAAATSVGQLAALEFHQTEEEMLRPDPGVAKTLRLQTGLDDNLQCPVAKSHVGHRTNDCFSF